MYKHRLNYWSLSPLAKYLRTRAGLTNPSALTMEEWDDHRDECKQKAPITNWVTNKGFNKAQDIVYFIPDVYTAIKTADIWKLFRNLWLFRKVLWNYRPWDFSGMMQFMIVSAKDMAEAQEKHGNHVGHLKTAKELRIFAELLDRVMKDEYTKDKLNYIKGKGLGRFESKPNTLPSYKCPRSFYKLTGQQRKHELELASKIMSRKLLSWWN